MTDKEFEDLYLYKHCDVLWKNLAVLCKFVEKHNKLVYLED